MARSDFQTLPGTRDLLEPDSGRARRLVEVFAEEASRAGFGLIVPPMFEDVGVFVRLGEASDVVTKELYAFTDKGGRDIALRPEFTASVCRAFAENRPLTPWTTWYAGPNFRYDKPQAATASSTRWGPRSSAATIPRSTSSSSPWPGASTSGSASTI